jgi:NADPH:quinone reductase-like Zn-dependent oxidoreductase
MIRCLVTRIARTMHGVQLVGHGGVDKLLYRDDLPVPKPAAGEVLVAVHAAGINNTDINTRIGWYAASVVTATADTDTAAASGSWTGEPFVFPRIQGADVCGLIAAVGAGVPPSRVGERVIIQSCLRSLAHRNAAPWLGSERDGGFAQFVCAPSADTYRVDCALSDAQLAAVPCSYATAENLLTRAGVASGERVLVTGASGGVGSALVALAHRRGALVIAVTSAEKADAVRRLGASAIVPRGGDIVGLAGRDQVDVVIDVVGGGAFAALLAVLAPGGRYATSGAIAGPLVELDLRTVYLKDLTLYGATMQHAGVFEQLVSYLERGQLEPLVAATYPLSQIADAQRVFVTKQHVGSLVLIPPAAS